MGQDLLDIAARSDAAPDLARVERDLSRTVAEIAADLRALSQMDLPDDVAAALAQTRDRVDQLGQMIDGRLAPLVPPEAAAAEVRLDQLVKDIDVHWCDRATARGLEFIMRLGNGLPMQLKVDRIALERVLSAALSKAIRVTPAGTVTFAVIRTSGGGVRFTVTDGGPGFSADALAADDAGATSLGQPALRDLVARMGGRLFVRNLDPRGAEVRLTLPAEACLDLDTAHIDRHDAPLPDLSGLRILVAGDSPANQTAITQMMTRLGAEVEVAGDGAEAMDWLRRETFDLALIDIEMPVMTGTEVIATLRAAPPPLGDLPVIAVTAHVTQHNSDAILDAGATAILPKPLGDIAAVAVAVSAAVDRSRGGDGSDPADALPQLDQTRFDHLMQIAGPQGAAELLARLDTDLRGVARGLDRALEEADWAAVRADTHVLVALAGAVGAARLHAKAEALNRAAHRNASADCARLGRSVLILLDRLVQYVADHPALTKEQP